MLWFETTDKELDEERIANCEYRLWISVLLLSFRDYLNLHRTGYLKEGRVTSKCRMIGKRFKNSANSYRKPMAFTSVTEVHELVEFISGPGIGVILDMCGFGAGTERAIRKGLKNIEEGNYMAIPGYEPDTLDRTIKVWTGTYGN